MAAAITKAQVDSAKASQDAAYTARENEWGGQATNSTGYSVMSLLSAVQGCNPNSNVTRKSDGGIDIVSISGKGSCTNSNYSNLTGQLSQAISAYNTKQNNYLVAKSAYDTILAQYNSQPDVKASAENIVNAGKTRNIIIVIVVIIIASVSVFVYLKHKALI